MYKQASYKEKFLDLDEWMSQLIDSVKKELRNDHLKKDVYFVKKFLQAKNIHRVTGDELAQAYRKAIQEEEKGEAIAEFIASRWLLKNSEMYDFFERALTQISPDFANIDELDAQQAQEMIEASAGRFGVLNTYLFAVLNSVVFPADSFLALKIRAREDRQSVTKEEQFLEQLTGEEERRSFELAIARLTDKYEKKLSGLQKKYVNDVDTLKKQVAVLQRRLQHQKGI